jgi:hypothetical protein
MRSDAVLSLTAFKAPWQEKVMDTIGLGDAAWQNTSLQLADDANAQTLLAKLVEHFNRFKIKAVYDCKSHECSSLASSTPSTAAASFAVLDMAGPDDVDVTGAEELPPQATVPVGIGTGSRLLSIEVDPAGGGLVMRDVTEVPSDAVACKKIVLDSVSGGSYGKADFSFDLEFEVTTATGGTGAAATVKAKAHIDVSGSYEITLGKPVLRHIVECTGPKSCVPEQGIVQVPVNSKFNLSLSATVSASATITIKVGGLDIGKISGGSGSYSFIAKLDTGGSSTAEVPVSCAPQPAPIPPAKK